LNTLILMHSIAFLWILNLLLMNTGLLLACRRQDVGLVRPHHLSFVVVSWFLKFHICFSSKSASILYPFEVGLPLLMFKPDCSSMKASGKQHIFSFCYVFQARRRTGTPRENIKNCSCNFDLLTLPCTTILVSKTLD